MVDYRELLVVCECPKLQLKVIWKEREGQVGTMRVLHITGLSSGGPGTLKRLRLGKAWERQSLSSLELWTRESGCDSNEEANRCCFVGPENSFLPLAKMWIAASQGWPCQAHEQLSCAKLSHLPSVQEGCSAPATNEPLWALGQVAWSQGCHWRLKGSGHKKWKWKSCLAGFKTFTPYGLYSPWILQVRITGAGTFSFSRIFPTLRIKTSVSYCRWISYQLSCTVGSSRILEAGHPSP